MQFLRLLILQKSNYPSKYKVSIEAVSGAFNWCLFSPHGRAAFENSHFLDPDLVGYTAALNELLFILLQRRAKLVNALVFIEDL